MKNLKTIILGFGWVLFGLSLGSSYVFNSFQNGENNSAFAPISWSDHLLVMDGALSCSLTTAELQDRIAMLKTEIFPKVARKEEVTEGYIYYFEDEGLLATHILEFIGKEKQCCPFFKFDFSILPFNKGLALKISGSKGVKDFLDMNESTLQEN